MTDATILDLTRSGIITLMLILAPLLISMLVIGLLISVFQAATQVNEQTLVFVPKLVVAFIVVVVAGPWMADRMIQFTTQVFAVLPQLTR